MGGESSASTSREPEETAESVFATLPSSVQSALAQLDAALADLPSDEAESHMRRCVTSGLWDPGAGMPERDPSPTGDSDEPNAEGDDDESQAAAEPREDAREEGRFEAASMRSDATSAEDGAGSSEQGPPVFFSTRPLVVRDGWELDSAMCTERISPDTTLIVLQTKDLPDGTRRARVALEGELVPQGWVSWVTANGSIGLVPRQGSVHLNLPPPQAAPTMWREAEAPPTPSGQQDYFNREAYRPGKLTPRSRALAIANAAPMRGRTAGRGGPGAPLAALKGSLARDGSPRGGLAGASSSMGRQGAPGRTAATVARFRSPHAAAQGAAEAPVGMPTDLPYDAEKLLSRFGKQGVREFAVPLGDGWMQRAGRGSFTTIEEGKDAKGGGDGPVMQVQSTEPNFYLLTYDQTPDAHVTRTGHYRIEATVRCLPGTTIKEQPYAALVINWQRGRSTVTAPCFTALVITQGAWRIDQYNDGSQTTLAEVHDTSLKPGNGLSLAAPWQRVAIEVRGDRLSVHANKRPIFGSFVIPPPLDSTSLAQNRVVRTVALTGPAGIATFRSRVQLRKFELSPLEGADGDMGALAGEPKPAFVGGDPKLVEAIEGEMLETSPDVSWESIGGLADAKRLLNEAVVLPLLIPEYFAAAACRSAWKGVLLFGPPGTGKTLLARAVASLGKTAFFNISASSLVSHHFGESEKLARTLFALARHHGPSIVFFDEVDALVSTRGAAGEHEASRRLKSELLSQMDGVGSGGGGGGGSGAPGEGQVMVLATSNKPWDLDEAMRRRLERRIYVPLPCVTSRKEMLEIHLNGVRLAPDLSFFELAKLTVGYSGADLQLACRDASMMPMRRMVEGKSPLEIVELQAAGALEGEVTMKDFRQALETTQPSTAAHEHDAYKAWNDEYGSHKHISNISQGEKAQVSSPAKKYTYPTSQMTSGSLLVTSTM